MNIPGFAAESSLGPTVGMYRGKAVSGRLVASEVLPMQGFPGSSTLNRNLGLCWGTWLGCPVNGHIIFRCVSWLEDCRCGPGGAYCHPKIFENQG